MAVSANTTRRSLIKAGAALPAIGVPSLVKAKTPDERIADAVEELKSALAEQHPDWEIVADGGINTTHNAVTGITRESQVVIVVYAQERYQHRRRVTWGTQYL